MKRVAMMTVALVLSVMVVGQAMAQQEGRKQRPARPDGAQMRGMGAMGGVMMALRGLDLSEQQRTQVREIMAADREQLQQLGQQAALTEEQQQKRRELMQEVMAAVREGKIERGQVREEIAKAVASVQTAEQKKAAEALQEKVQELIGKIKKVMTSDQVEALEKALAEPQERPARGQRGERGERGERPERGEGRRPR